MAQSKLKRKPCFSDEEIRSLVDSFGEHKDLLLRKFNNSITNQKKKKVWADITAAVNARAAHVKRSVDEVKKKWKDLLSKAKKDASSQKNPPTGGGPRQQISPYSEIILEIYGRESPSVIGIANAIESASASVPLAVDEENECREYDPVSLQETRIPISLENDERPDERQALLISEDPEIGEVEACSSKTELQLVEDSSTTRAESSKSGARGVDKKLNWRDQMDKVQLEVLTAELSRIEAEKRKFEVEKEVLLLKKRKLQLELQKMGAEENTE